LRRDSNRRLPDALIAATALEHRLTLVTRNARDFDGIRGLMIVHRPIRRSPVGSLAAYSTGAAYNTAARSTPPSVRMAGWPLRPPATTLRVMRQQRIPTFARALATALVGAALLTAPAAAEETRVTLQDDTKGCNGVLPSTDGNTDMRLVGGTLTPGGTAVFEITYPLDANDVGKQFTITACAFINDVATLKYLVSFVPSNQSFRLRMTFAVPVDAPVGGEYCNYVKTTRSPTAAQSSQRKAGPSCFIIRPPSTTGNQPPQGPTGGGSPPPGTGTPGPGTPGGDPPLLPNTAMPR